MFFPSIDILIIAFNLVNPILPIKTAPPDTVASSKIPPLPMAAVSVIVSLGKLNSVPGVAEIPVKAMPSLPAAI